MGDFWIAFPQGHQERVFRSGQGVGEGAERRPVLGVGLPEQDLLGRRARGSQASAFL